MLICQHQPQQSGSQCEVQSSEDVKFVLHQMGGTKCPEVLRAALKIRIN